jgi:hypothetical protein
MVFSLCVLFTGMCAAVVTHETITCATSVNRISGTVVGYGNLNPGVKVEVFDKPEVWADDALSLRLFDFGFERDDLWEKVGVYLEGSQ